MGAKSRKSRRHNALSILFYVLCGVALLLVFLPIWEKISEFRVLILVLLVIVFVVLQALDWQRQRAERKERRRRCGLSRRMDGDSE